MTKLTPIAAALIIAFPMTSLSDTAAADCPAGTTKDKAGECPTQALVTPWQMDHSQMDHSQMDHSQMDHSQMDHSQMDHSQMDHSQMGHSVAAGEPIPVSDGSAAETIPMPFPGAMMMHDDPLLAKVTVDQLEVRDHNDGTLPWVLEANGWIGKDLHKFWWTLDLESAEGDIEHATAQFLYGRAVAPYWDIRAGLRTDLEPENRQWLSLGFRGVAPYFIETTTDLFVDKDGYLQWRLKGEKELMLTQRWVVIPEASLLVSGKTDDTAALGTGLANVSAGIRLAYELRREFAPYLGAVWSKPMGNTAERRDDADADTALVAGVKAWF